MKFSATDLEYKLRRTARLLTPVSMTFVALFWFLAWRERFNFGRSPALLMCGSCVVLLSIVALFLCGLSAVLTSERIDARKYPLTWCVVWDLIAIPLTCPWSLNSAE